MRLLIILCALFLAGCQTPQKIEVIKKQIEGINISVPKTEPLILKQIKWKVVIHDDVSYIALTTDEYAKLSSNMLTLQKFIKNQNYIINTLKEYNKTEK